uniref:Uncharacterized protein n=1 Tax=Glossina brevipalpis TaxID=37001 RepID=A0A1A9WTQ5_9MUSC
MWSSKNASKSALSLSVSKETLPVYASHFLSACPTARLPEPPPTFPYHYSLVLLPSCATGHSYYCLVSPVSLRSRTSAPVPLCTRTSVFPVGLLSLFADLFCASLFACRSIMKKPMVAEIEIES